MIDLVILGIVVVLIIVVASFIYKNSLIKKIDDVESRKNLIAESTVGDSLEATSKIKLNGESYNHFNQYKDEYNKIFNTELLSIQRDLDEARRSASSFKLLSANVLLSDIDEDLKRTEQVLENVEKGLVQLQTLDSEHREAVDNIESTLREVNQQLLAQNYSFGPSSEKLEDKLNSIKQVYDEFVESTENGDQDKSEKLLDQINASIKELAELMKLIPDTYAALSKEFPRQLDEIDRGHSTMIQTDYNFIDDEFDETLTALKEACQDGLNSLSTLDIPETKKTSRYIEDTIDSLYEIMEKEIVSKRKVKKNLSLIYDYIFHAKNQNRILLEELDGLSKNYNLEHNELEDANELSDKIEKIESIYNEDAETITNKKAVYSVIQRHQQDAKQELSAIEKRQKDINDSVADLSEEERVARDRLQKFDLQLLTIRRRIDNLNLPGLTEDFLERYDYVYNDVQKLSSSINQVKISMDEINQKLANISDSMNDLIRDTDNIVDSAMLAERLMQYANRYRNDNAEIDEACAKAKEYFDIRYQYEKSLATIAAAIEKVNPGAYKQIETEYYDEKSNTK
ncbi:septation ring formation regulator EzrA [Apilactobacillus apinorum]|uniref:Septation ring formation regulator EzrA n=1 Tax=Apilactobacillus apinorum TaxID=1218495 RepID=A0ABP9ZJ79_9LACO